MPSPNKRSGHVHCYERTLPVYQGALNDEAPFYITNGAGGNGMDDTWGDAPEWSAKRCAQYWPPLKPSLFWVRVRTANSTF